MPPARSEATFHAANHSQWKAWLEEHHNSCSAVWLVFHKVGADPSCLTYDQALDEALCFGWIDGKIRRIDDDTYARRFNVSIEA